MKKGETMRSDANLSSQLTKNALKEHKKRVGEVVLVAISPRTTIELPANLSQAERDVRIELYKKLHSSKV
ncbi:hypothetical protein H8784_10160 [Parabacteroides acidifaciens]|uniref:Uncharacterized protein n=1 Tax=Parabacteroides acidifaciens TaxID=2290935 RepID=A0A3D8HDX8_9BACT|nr:MULTISPECIES: hypothetical protein [Parabacteroides]MBC8602080.1 hypothetical protein [Parabacteroides acidifaciens]RDU49179.1 hypothetical protein DWU89_10420 [Parabacteroides acidifaciens]RHO70108.1 hypothetical protein DW083_14185 [Parabacteroides sp. AF48-14]RHR59556.1 hypothetical protein DWW90_08545 [Parabacteroides sp. AF17-28]